ncbi:PREDICTED: uncharacterized protein LOC109470032 [Branchiostoma belcheri]|uniref:Uncharacterized protein LOC109470032 n=1 Tax=Branchiostoma belcheri TaxID=7741 RepID=A0A6P4YZW5_BRABE|nr:PREDICTED: uncharacterized protein LOC109470032 [Branchiostoma belcheri]
MTLGIKLSVCPVEESSTVIFVCLIFSTDGAKNCREFFTSRPKGLLTLAVCIGVIVVVTAATVVAVILNPHSAPRFHNEENTTTFPVYSTTSYTYLPVTSSTHLIVTSTTSSTVTIDWWSEWILYIRKYFQHDKDARAAMGLEERYSDNEVVMTLLEGRFFWPFVCRYWKERAGLPNSLAGAVTHCILHGVSSDEYMKTHGLATYREVFQSILDALEALYMSNTTQAHKDNDHTHLSLSGVTLSGDDVEALASLFPYLRGLFSLQLMGCGLSAEAATSMAGQIHQLNALNTFYLGKNMIGDGGMEAIAEMFPHLKELRTLDIRENSITSVGGKTMVEKLVELQELRNINLAGNELALSLSSLAKAFDNMTRLESVRLWPITCRADSFREAALQVRDAVHTLKGKVFSYFDWWSEWILYIRKYFQHDKDALAAMGLEERYSDNEVVMTLLEVRFFWPFVCRYWKERAGLPNSLAGAVTHCILHGVSSDEYMKTHGLATYGEVFQSILYALEALYMSNTTQGHKDNDHTHLSLSGLTLFGDDVEALTSLFPYLRGLFSLQLMGCGLSAKAATSMAGQIHQLNALNSLYLGKNMIGDGGMEAIAEMFPHLKELRTLDIRENSITSVGGKAMVEKLVELQELRNINLAGNELALSLSSLAKAFDNMTRLESVRLWPITCRADSFREAALQVRDAVHTLKGKVFSYFGMQRHLLYDGAKHAAGSSRLDTAWQRSRVEQKVTSGVYIKTNG